MPISSHLLERAYQLIDANQLQDAEMVLDALVRVDPKNIPAWEAYLEIHQCCGDLEWGMERVLNIKELSNEEREKILAYQTYLIEHTKEYNENFMKITEKVPSANTPLSLESDVASQEGKVMFELLDEYEYPARKIERNKKRRTRKMFVYKLPDYVWHAIGLLVVFYISIKLLVLGHLFGYLMMGGLIVDGFFWLRSLNVKNATAPLVVGRAFTLESENELYIIDKPITEEKADTKLEKVSTGIRYLDE
jgi:hypothetical protein